MTHDAAPLTSEEATPSTFGPMVHRFGHRHADEWDIPFTTWTLLRAIDADGREHIFEVPTATLDQERAAPSLDVERLREALEEVDREMLGCAEKGGDFIDGAEWVLSRVRFAALRDEGETP